MSNPVHAGAWGASGAILQKSGWSWREPRGPEHFRRCSYCGCINPEDLVAEKGWHAEWADQKYGWPHKFYVTIPDKLGKLDWLGGSTGEMSDTEVERWGYKRVADLTEEEREACERVRVNLDMYKVVRVAVRATHRAKFYTEHLQDPDISDEVKDEIHRRCGLVFEWLEGGRVRWHPYDYSEQS